MTALRRGRANNTGGQREEGEEWKSGMKGRGGVSLVGKSSPVLKA